MCVNGEEKEREEKTKRRKRNGRTSFFFFYLEQDTLLFDLNHSAQLQLICLSFSYFAEAGLYMLSVEASVFVVLFPCCETFVVAIPPSFFFFFPPIPASVVFLLSLPSRITAPIVFPFRSVVLLDSLPLFPPHTPPIQAQI